MGGEGRVLSGCLLLVGAAGLFRDTVPCCRHGRPRTVLRFLSEAMIGHNMKGPELALMCPNSNCLSDDRCAGPM